MLESGPEVDERPTGRFRGRVGIADAILDRLQRAREIDPNAIRTLINRLDKVKQQWLAT
jgi:predicted transcriptional regulator